MAYSIANTASSMNFPYKSPIVTCDNYQLTLTVIRKRVVRIINANVQIVDINSQTDAQQSTPMVSCLVDYVLLQSGCATVRHHLRSAPSSMGLGLHDCITSQTLQSTGIRLGP